MTKNKIVLLACGSFNPPTYMHLRMFELARDYFNSTGFYQVVGGIISPVHNGYGKKELVDISHRLALIRLALKDSDWIHLSDWEASLDSWTPTRKVIQYHQNKINSAISNYDGIEDKINEADEPAWIRSILQSQSNIDFVSVKLLCGADFVESFKVPNLWQETDIETILGDHGLAVITRDGVDIARIIYESDILNKFKTKIDIIREWFANEVSSTKVRRSLRRGESVKYIIPDSLISYIQTHCLYRSTYDNKYSIMYEKSNSSIFDLSPGESTEIILTPLQPQQQQQLGEDIRDSTGNYRSPLPPGVHGGTTASSGAVLLAGPGLMRGYYSPVKGPPGGLQRLPGVAVPVFASPPAAGGGSVVRKVGSGLGAADGVGEVLSEEAEEDLEEAEEEEEETRVEIQITEDGRIEVISDKETTV